VVGLDAGQVNRWKSWHRWTAICLLAYGYLALSVALQRQHDAGSDLDVGLIPVTTPELLRLLRDRVIPPPRRDRPHRLHWSAWRRRHQHRARQAHQRWNAYIETTPRSQPTTAAVSWVDHVTNTRVGERQPLANRPRTNATTTRVE
jgi:hypothetical protein